MPLAGDGTVRLDPVEILAAFEAIVSNDEFTQVNFGHKTDHAVTLSEPIASQFFLEINNTATADCFIRSLTQSLPTLASRFPDITLGDNPVTYDLANQLLQVEFCCHLTSGVAIDKALLQTIKSILPHHPGVLLLKDEEPTPETLGSPIGDIYLIGEIETTQRRFADQIDAQNAAYLAVTRLNGNPEVWTLTENDSSDFFRGAATCDLAPQLLLIPLFDQNEHPWGFLAQINGYDCGIVNASLELIAKRRGNAEEALLGERLIQEALGG